MIGFRLAAKTDIRHVCDNLWDRGWEEWKPHGVETPDQMYRQFEALMAPPTRKRAPPPKAILIGGEKAIGGQVAAVVGARRNPIMPYAPILA